MKKRIYNLANFLAFNVLFFAVYLNFIQKTNNPASTSKSSVKTEKETLLQTQVVENPEEYINARTSIANNSKSFEPVYANENSPSL